MDDSCSGYPGCFSRFDRRVRRGVDHSARSGNSSRMAPCAPRYFSWNSTPRSARSHIRSLAYRYTSACPAGFYRGPVATLRSAGIIALHDENKAFESEARTLKATGPIRAGLADPIAVATTFKAVVIEGIEVVFIVIAVGAAGGHLAAAGAGAALAGLLVVALGLLLHRPLARIPENLLKFSVG